MRLVEAIREAATCADDLIIYVFPPWSPDADTVFVVDDGNDTKPVRFHGQDYSYFLEASIAREFLEDYSVTAEGVAASERDRCERLIRYATDDA